MNFRVISISKDDQASVLDIYEWFTGVTNEHTLTPAEIEVGEDDKLVIIWAQDNFHKAIELGRKFYQTGVLTLGVFPEHIEERGCFDAQTVNDGNAILSIVRALTESVCINLYGELPSDFKSWGIDKINNLFDIIPKTSSALFGIHQLPDTLTCIPDDMKREESFGISFVLAGKEIEI